MREDGGRYCSYTHARQALAEEISEEEIEPVGRVKMAQDGAYGLGFSA